MTFVVTAKELVLALQDEPEHVRIQLNDASSGALVDATRLGVTIRPVVSGSSVLYRDSLSSPPSPPGVTRILHPSTGIYEFPLGDQSLIANNEVRCARRLLAVWRIEVGTQVEPIVQSLAVVSPEIFDLIRRFRANIDKARKEVHDDPENPCFLGYTDADLLEYLQGGLETWNMYEPYPTFCTLESFPSLYHQGLIEAALLVGVASQKLFAIDSDVPNYSAQGAAFVINHQQPLAEHLNYLAQRLDKLIPIAKLKFVRSGAIHTQIAPNARLQTLINMAPDGALFRNMFISGGG